MLNINVKRSIVGITVFTVFSFILLNPSYATLIGNYELADFSHDERAITLGSGIDADNISLINGLNTLDLSGDNEFVKTDGDLAGFTYQNDWSWMTIIQSNQSDGYRAFMRGWAWQDKQGDFDLRLSANNNTMFTWHRAPGWVNSSASSSAINNHLVWLAGTYDYSTTTSTLYVNGMNVGEYNIAPMDDRNNTNPLSINGQWAGNIRGVGNIYGEGQFSIAQLILSQSLFLPDELLSTYENKSYLTSNDDTWFDFRVQSQQIPEPGSIFLFISGLFGLIKFTAKNND